MGRFIVSWGKKIFVLSKLFDYKDTRFIFIIKKIYIKKNSSSLPRRRSSPHRPTSAASTPY